MSTHAPLPYKTLEIGAHSQPAGCSIYITDATGRKVAAIWGKAEEKFFTADLLANAANEHAKLVDALMKIAAFDDEGANRRLAATGTFSSFDEPGAVQVARDALRELGVLAR